MSKSNEKADIWMPLFIGDYLADTTRLTTEQHGAYILLIMDYWRNGAPPDDDEVLAQITRCSRGAWKKLRKSVENFFQIVDGNWRHSRIEKEKVSAMAGREKSVAKASSAASIRWERERAAKAALAPQADAGGNAPSMPQELHGAYPSPSPSQTTNPEAAVPLTDIKVAAGFDAGKTPPLPTNGEPLVLGKTPELELCIALRKAGVNVFSTNPHLLSWVSAGVPLVQLHEALEVAKQRKPGEAINPGYLNAILADIRNPKPAGQTAAVVDLKPWYQSAKAVDAKGAELGLCMAEGETWPAWRDRVFTACGPGPWTEILAKAAAPVVQGFKKAGMPADFKNVLKQQAN